jgi:ribulose-phosphate 3-epimerase
MNDVMKLPAKPAKLVAPSILSADFSYLGEAISRVESAGADWIHVDVMDGVFVPNITIGIPVLRSIRSVTGLPMDVHLMIVQPERHVEAFAEAGADIITVHYETCSHLQRVLSQIKSAGAKAGVALNPHTPIDGLRFLLDDIDMILLMSVNPGFSGQSFIETTYQKLNELDVMLKAADRRILVQVDGGACPANAVKLREAGADILVAGSAIFKSDDYNKVISALKL